MDTLLWTLAGAFAGWVGFKFVGANAQRGLTVSVAIGVIGALVGGYLLAPMMGDSAAMVDAFNPGTLLVVLASSAVCLTVSDMVWRRFAV